MANTTVVSVTVDGIGAVPVTVTSAARSGHLLLLHGGAGPQVVDGFAEAGHLPQLETPDRCSRRSGLRRRPDAEDHG